MDDDSLPDTINPNNFPAKLWRLVGNPSNKAIRWDAMGEVVVIDQQLFEREVLSPGTATPHEDSFKTTNFSSFVRQLNLYGFRKADPTLSSQAALDGGTCHYFYNPNFQRSHPEHVARLRRLTVDNKAKIRAGLDVSCRLPNRYQRSGGGDGRDKTLRRRSSPLLSPAHPQSAHPGLTDSSQVMNAYSGTPVPPRYQMRGQSGLPLSQHYSGPPSNSSALQAQQDFLTRANHGNTHFSGYNPPNPHYHPGFYSSVCHCCHPNIVAPPVADVQAGLYSRQNYCQAGNPVSVFDQIRDLPHKENQEGKKCDISLDAIFQIADEVMQNSPSTCLVKVETPERPAPDRCGAALCDGGGAAAGSAAPIIIPVLSCPALLTARQQEQAVVLVPEQMPEDAIYEVPCDQTKYEIINVETSDNPGDSSQG